MLVMLITMRVSCFTHLQSLSFSWKKVIQWVCHHWCRRPRPLPSTSYYGGLYSPSISTWNDPNGQCARYMYLKQKHIYKRMVFYCTFCNRVSRTLPEPFEAIHGNCVGVFVRLSSCLCKYLCLYQAHIWWRRNNHTEENIALADIWYCLGLFLRTG